MAGRGYPLDRGCAHVARAISAAPAWVGGLLLAVAPLPSRDLWWLHGRGLSAGLAALGGAILARRLHERREARRATAASGPRPADGAATPARLPFLDPEGLLTLPRMGVALFAMLLTLPMTVVGTGWAATDLLLFGFAAPMGAMCGALPGRVVVLAGAAWSLVVGLLATSFVPEAWAREWEFALRLEIQAVPGTLMLLRLGSERTAARWVLTAALVAVTATSLRVPANTDPLWHALLALADLFCASVLGPIAGEIRTSVADGAASAAIYARRSPWRATLAAGAVIGTTGAGLLARGTLVRDGLITAEFGIDEEPWLIEHAAYVRAALLTVAATLVVARAFGAVRPGDLVGRLAVPVVLPLFAVAPWVAEFARRGASAAVSEENGLGLAAVLAAVCAAAWIGRWPGRKPAADLVGIALHVAAATSPFWLSETPSPGIATLALFGLLALAVAMTPRSLLITAVTCGLAWGIASARCESFDGWPDIPGHSDEAGPWVRAPSPPAWMVWAVAGAAFGLASWLANRMRAMSILPPDHPVLTEGPFVPRAEADASAPTEGPPGEGPPGACVSGA